MIVETLDQFKQAVCEKLGIDPGDTPDGCDWCQIDMRPEYDGLELSLLRYDATILTKATYPIWGMNCPWLFRGKIYDSLDQINPKLLREELDMVQDTPTQLAPADLQHFAGLALQGLCANPELANETPRDLALRAVANAQALVDALGGVVN